MNDGPGNAVQPVAGSNAAKGEQFCQIIDDIGRVSVLSFSERKKHYWICPKQAEVHVAFIKGACKVADKKCAVVDGSKSDLGGR